MPIRFLRSLRTAFAGVAALATLTACADHITAPAAPAVSPRALLVTTSGAAYTQVSAGGFHTCALSATSTNGGVSCWGDNTYHQTDLPSALSNIVQVSAGYYHSCAVSSAGAVTCWGDIRAGATAVPTDLTTTAQVSSGFYHSCALSTAGAVTCWGDNSVSQTVVPSAALSGIVQIDAGGYDTCATSSAGGVICWGLNNSGEVSPPAFLSGITQVSAGGAHTCALSTAGAISCWGLNNDGQTTVPSAQGTTTHVYPTATFTVAPDSVLVGQSVALALSNAQVPGHPEATTFTYAFDCGTGMFAAPSSSSTASCPTTTTGSLTVRGEVIDQDGDTASYSAGVTVLTPMQATQLLRDAVAASSIAPSVRAGLLRDLDAALTALGRGNTAAARSALLAFQHEVVAQRGRAIPTATADSWSAQAAAIRAALGG